MRLAEIAALLYDNPQDIDSLVTWSPDVSPDKTSISKPLSSILCVYPDHVRSAGIPSLQVLNNFLDESFTRSFSCLHILPFFQSTGDGGFEISDYRKIRASLGCWADIETIGQRFDLMCDLVLNHVSNRHPWFEAFQAGEAHYQDYFITDGDKYDLTLLARPRKSPVLSSYPTVGGEIKVWTTYAKSQVDLNYQSVKVVLEIAELAAFLLSSRIKLLRLDAVAFIWKRVGSSCANLPEAGQIIRLIKAMLDNNAFHPGLIAETDFSYGAESINTHADYCYRYDFAPSLTHTLATRTTRTLARWLSRVSGERGAHEFITFISTHDGLYLRPQQPILTPDELAQLVSLAVRRGNHPVYKNADTGDVYEIAGPVHALYADERTIRRKLIVLGVAVTASCPGIPMFYLNTLLDAPYLMRTAEDSLRTTNRYVFEDVNGISAEDRCLLETCLDLIEFRKTEFSFQADATVEVTYESENVLCYARKKEDRTVYTVINLSSQKSADLDMPEPVEDLIIPAGVTNRITVKPLSFLWLLAR